MTIKIMMGWNIFILVKKIKTNSTILSIRGITINYITEEKTIVVYGEEKTSNLILKVLYNSKER